MSCPEFVYTPHGREGIGVIQPQSGLDYPLVKPSEDIRYLLADLYLAFDDRGEYYTDTPVAQFPLRIKYLLNVGCAEGTLPDGAPTPNNDADIVIVDQQDTEILNTATTPATCTVKNWGDDYQIYEWTTTNAVCRIVVHTTWKTGEPEPKEYAQYLAPVDATIDARAVYKMPKRLRSLRVRQKSGTITTGPYSGKIRFKNNYNTELTTGDTTTSGFVVDTRINFSAVAGSGAGYFPVCGDGYDEETQELIPQAIRRINGIQASDAGDFVMAGGDCMYMRRPTVKTGDVINPSPTAHQQAGADCTPCCACSEYVNAALYLNQLRDQYQLIGQRVGEVKALHDGNVTNWNDKRTCAVSNPLKLIMVPQCCPALDIVLMICNPCTTCFLPSTLVLNLASTTPNTQLNLACQGGTTIFNPDGSTAHTGIAAAIVPGGTQFAVQMPAVNPGSSAYVKFRVKSSQRVPQPIIGTLTGTFSDGSQIKTGCAGEVAETARTEAVATNSATLNCDASGNDNRTCVT